MKEKYLFPAIFEKDSDGYNISFPDLEGAITCADTFAEALYMAKDCLELYLDDLKEIPEPKDIKKLKANEMMIMIEANMLEFKKRNETKSVSTTVTLPKWLKDTAVSKKINLSSVLKNALIKELEL
ncbi:MAG: type II toxin-antitoxin system HicB family antitoxin [Fusobacterium gastrosuis]|uniref:type II toxin-antitoxin system HicB family antitoxin n=1 Tax=Fusobacterium gastrosuis TaxID=1755100 RepID=UPI002A8BB1E9|nr:type II toxin-antitoxin system HicB family antitoxin [Fusobacterium gastrosuis]